MKLRILRDRISHFFQGVSRLGVGVSAFLASILLFGNHLADLIHGKALLWLFVIFDRLRGEIVVMCVLMLLGGWIAEKLIGGVRGIRRKNIRDISRKDRAELITIALLSLIVIGLGAYTLRYYSAGRKIAWRHYKETLLLRAENALAERDESKGTFLLKVTAEVSNNEEAVRMLRQLEARRKWSALFWHLYSKLPEDSLARWELLEEEERYELSKTRFNSETEAFVQRYQEARGHFVVGIGLLVQGDFIKAKQEIGQACNTVSWIGNCGAILREISDPNKSGQVWLPALTRYGATEFLTEVLHQDDDKFLPAPEE